MPPRLGTLLGLFTLILPLASAVAPRVVNSTYSLRNYYYWSDQFTSLYKSSLSGYDPTIVLIERTEFESALIVTDFDQDVFLPSSCQPNTARFVRTLFSP